MSGYVKGTADTKMSKTEVLFSGSIPSRAMVRGNLSEEVIHKWKPECSEGASQADIWGIMITLLSSLKVSDTVASRAGVSQWERHGTRIGSNLASPSY